jgi:NitT/TauT family transport system substrate-binding protein
MNTIRTLVAAAALSFGMAAQAAVDLTVTHFGTGMYGVPFAVAKAKGWFKSEANLDVGGFITSKGGGTTVRNALAADLPYGEVALSAAIVAIQQGAEITIIHSGVISVADQMWSTRKDDTSIKTYADLKGKVLGFSSPRSVTDMITTIMLNEQGLTDKVAELVQASLRFVRGAST